ncbi:DUF305 domain-containing protein [Gilvimarinus sp. F26214L]|uniref:DUF305 domain-containing protein n=1 Tax=Gilvimarinus sp. DZF01 TaxID=3461371 RepID=UPI004045FDE2
MHMSYWRFAAMIATSTVVMFGLMYLNAYAFEHVMWSETRLWMAIVMGACMAVIMLSYMLSMYQNKAINAAIFVGSIIVFAGALWLVRSQVTVNQTEYMKAMVPHHSIAIMTSNRAQITDPRVRKLADEIIEAQEREIAEMKYLIADLDQATGEGTAIEDKPVAELTAAREAIENPNIRQSDPESMVDAEIRQLVAGEARCGFSYTIAGDPVFAVGPPPAGSGTTAGLKLHGRLVRLETQSAVGFDTVMANGGRFTADGIQIELVPLPEETFTEDQGTLRRPANLHFELPDEGLRVGYRGWYSCEGQL